MSCEHSCLDGQSLNLKNLLIHMLDLKTTQSLQNGGHFLKTFSNHVMLEG